MPDNASMLSGIAFRIREKEARQTNASVSNIGGLTGAAFSFFLKFVPYSGQYGHPIAQPRHGNTQVNPGGNRDTNGRRRQRSKLPEPFPSYPPFTLRYGVFAAQLRSGRCHASDNRAGFPLVPLMLSFLRSGHGQDTPFHSVPARRQSWRPAQRRSCGTCILTIHFSVAVIRYVCEISCGAAPDLSGY